MKSEFQKKMDLLDPNYVVPQSERVSNRKSFAIKTEPIQKNEAGLDILPDQPVNQAMQELYLRRMNDLGAVDKLDQEMTPVKRLYDLETGEDLTDLSQIHPAARSPQSVIGDLVLDKPNTQYPQPMPPPTSAPEEASQLESALIELYKKKRGK